MALENGFVRIKIIKSHAILTTDTLNIKTPWSFVKTLKGTSHQTETA
jgi:hypothetical protein